MSSDQNQEATPTNNRDSAPTERLYITATPIRFTPRGTRNTISDSNVVMLDPRNVQQWQLDATEARIDEATTTIDDFKRRLDHLEDRVSFNSLLHDEAEDLRDDLDDLKLARQKTSKGGCSPWKTVVLVLVFVGVAVGFSCQGYQQHPFDLVDFYFSDSRDEMKH
ncbi:hypothetical protein NW762_004652 [Fusarium torreyae]|uniref:Uncharacterized protein n=1 Tax=Fusarium torreyae TaxID=1237075 RepID=A0A9W8S3X2_9HYPO|nr:hypothetical protein NW762_004652 [Fusarium torreyae]